MRTLDREPAPSAETKPAFERRLAMGESLALDHGVSISRLSSFDGDQAGRYYVTDEAGACPHQSNLV